MKARQRNTGAGEGMLLRVIGFSNKQVTSKFGKSVLSNSQEKECSVSKGGDRDQENIEQRAEEQ